ncbi:hypothetical protein FRB99_003162 [Tulasnella sp. 403]|nr:hypothetical protein FRB99_003162 [Tulasnella sp. 403]
MSNVVTINSADHPVNSEGKNEVLVENLPNSLDPDSIRLEGLGSAVILDVVHSPPPQVEDARAVFLADPKAKTIIKRNETLESDIDILEEQDKLLDTYSKSLKAGKADHKALNLFFDLYAEKKKENQKGLVELREALKISQAGWDELEKAAMADAKSQKRAAKLNIIVQADKDGKVELSLWYVVSGASWTPMYDLRAKISKDKSTPSKVTLQYRASITQSTAEDWNDVDLSLSTASPLIGGEIPKLPSFRIGHEYRNRRFRETKRMSTSDIPFYAVGFKSSAPEPAPVMKERSTVVKEAPTSAVFEIEGKSNIPSGDKGETHRVSIAVIDLDAKLEWISIPKEKASVYLRCQVKNTSQYILLDGACNVFMDNNFICKSKIPNVSPRENFSASLGVDPAVKVTYHPRQQKVKNSSGGVLASKVDVSSFTQRITIKNTRGETVSPLFVKDQVPVSTNTAFKVVMVEPHDIGLARERREIVIASGVKARWSFTGTDEDEGKAEISSVTGTSNKRKSTIVTKHVGGSGVEEEGVIEWVCDMEAGKTVDLALAWDVIAPTGQTWVDLGAFSNSSHD